MVIEKEKAYNNMFVARYKGHFTVGATFAEAIEAMMKEVWWMGKFPRFN